MEKSIKVQSKNTSEWRLKKNYQTMKITKGSCGSIIALTRKIARIVFSMLNNKQAFNLELMKKAI